MAGARSCPPSNQSGDDRVLESSSLYGVWLTEDEVIALSQGHISPSLKEKAVTILKPLTRTDNGQTRFVYTADRLEQEKDAHGEVHRLS